MDLAARRQEFPALATSETPRLAYLDSAATTLVPRAVLDATTRAMTTLGNPGRGAYARAQAANDALSDAREIVASALVAWRGTAWASTPGAGVLWARPDTLPTAPPWQLGGGMVARVDLAGSTFHAAPARFEAGTPNTPAIVGLGAALVWARETFLASKNSASTVRDDEATVHEALCETIRAAGARILGEPQVGVVSFAWDYHPHDIATIADREGVALRSGHHCAQLVHKRFGVDASTRASVGCYSGLDDVEQLARALAKVREVLGSR